MSLEKRPILVTGAAGFIGSRYVDRCNELDQSVIAVDLPEHFESRSQLLRTRFDHVVAREVALDWLEQTKPALSSIVHLGACANTMEGSEHYLQRMNVDYSQRLWKFATREKIPFVYASSAATYGAGERGYDDDESRMARLEPLNAYGRSKLDFDLWALDQSRAGLEPPAWSGFKFFNVYGFGEDHKGSMASVVLHSFRQIRRDGRVRLFESHRKGIPHGHQMRDFVAVEDVIDVLEFARTKPLKRGIYNLGTGLARSFLDLARATFRAMSAPERIEFVPTPESIRDKYQYFTEASMDKLHEAGYRKPFLSLEEGVERYVARLKSGS